MEELFFLLIGVFSIVLIVVGIVTYIFGSIGLMRIAETMEVENAWLAWIPIGSSYILGKVVGDRLEISGKEINNLSIVLAAGSAIAGALSGVDVIGTLVLVAFSILVYMTVYNIYKMYDPKSAQLYIILSVFIPIVYPFLLFKLSKQSPIDFE